MMDGALVYCIKVMLFHGAAYAVYWALLRKSNHFSLNRAYLLGTLILGFTAPVVMLPVTVSTLEPVVPAVNLTAGTFSEVENTSLSSASIRPVGEYPAVVDIIYVAGVAILTLRSVLSVISIRRIKARSIEEPGTSPKVFRIREAMSFSFINTILLQESAGPAVFLHEKGHVTGKHWLDLIFLEIVCIVCWMNPMVWLYKKSLSQQHEYLADHYVLHHGVSREDYLLCILNYLSCHAPIGPVHKFNSQSLKQRIFMITKDRFFPYSKVVYMLIVPLVALLFLGFSGRESHERLTHAGSVFVIDAAHGGDDTGSISASGIPEKKVSLQLARLVQKIGKEKGVSILLTRTTDRQLSLRERVDFCVKAKADAFLSLHLGFEKDGAGEKAGIFVSDENAKFADSKRMAAALTGELDDIKQLGSPAVHNSNAFVLKNNHVASAMLELGYLSDEEDAKFISDPANQRRIAEKIVSGLMKY